MDREWIRIPDVLFFQEGPGVRNTQYTTEGVKLLNVANLVDGKVDLSTSNRYISDEEAYGKYKHFLCDEGDFIVASSGIKVEYIDKKMGFIDKSMLPLCMNTSTIRFKVLNPKQLRIRYFMYYLKSQHFKGQLAKLITGSAQLNYGPSHLKQMIMPLITVDGQDDIVDKLDKLQEIIDLRKQQIKGLDELIKSRFVEMFGDPIANPMGWEKYPLRKKCEIITGNTPSRKVSAYYGDYIEWIKSDNINTPNAILTTAEEYLSEEGLKVGRCVDAGAILMTCIAGSLGCIGNVAIADRQVSFNQQINGIIPRKNNTWFMYVLFELSKKGIQGSINMALKGILSKGQLAEMEFIFPPIDLQDKFADFVEQTNKLKVVVQTSLDKTQMMLDSLMQNYFG